MIDIVTKRRIWGTLAGNSFTRLMRVAEQLLLVPLFLSVWGAQRYGEWIALNALATFVTLGNFGIAHAGLSDIVLRYASGNTRAAARSFVTSMVMLTVIIIGIYGVVNGALHMFDLRSVVALHSLTYGEAKSIILIVTLSTLFYFYGEPFNGVISAAIGAATPSLLFAISKAAELVGTAIALVISGDPVVVALTMLGATLLNLALNLVISLKYTPWISFSLRDFDAEALRRTWKPSVGFFILLVCVAVFDGQVPRLIVFHYFGGVALASFSILVIYTRAARLLALTMSQAVQVEIGRAFAHDKLDQVKGLIETILGSAIGIAGLILAAEIILAPIVIPIWTHGNVTLSWGVLLALALVAFVGAYFDAAVAAVAALNRVTLVALGYGGSLAVGLIAGVVALPYLGSAAIALGLVLPELGGSWAAIHTLRQALKPVHLSALPRSLWPKTLLDTGRSSSERI